MVALTTTTTRVAGSLKLLLLLVAAQFQGGVRADIHLHYPRGSNNRLSEQSNGVANAGRLFDSQNKNAAGYQICDACEQVCHQEGTDAYDETKEGAMKGQMVFYAGSKLPIFIDFQQGGGVDHPHVHSQIVVQYMSDSDNPNIRDGTLRGGENTAGGQQEPPQAADAADPTLGEHESMDSYLKCKARERNRGLYIADQNVRNDRGATATRQNPSGNMANTRHGLECPEERDYYPYWHAAEWHDVAIFTDEPGRCGYYRKESQNVMARHECSEPQYNNERDCRNNGGSWKEKSSWKEDPPMCIGGMRSRNNHNGNVQNGAPWYHLWEIPEYLEGTFVLRVRYNITTKDGEDGSVARPSTDGVEIADDKADYFFIDHAYNGEDAIVKQDSREDFIGFGMNYALEVQMNTNQHGRVFEDRTHTFRIKPRPSSVPENAEIYNFGVRGRRGNIVQVYPAVEYDFVPPNLHVTQGDYVHFQFCGSDANPAGNEGNGKQGTDRSNMVQVQDSGESLPLPLEKHTFLCNMEGDPSGECRNLVKRFAFLDQNASSCDPADQDGNSLTNCAQLNAASAYIDFGAIEMTEVGEFHLLSTRNSDFSNRSQKTTITVRRRWWPWYAFLGVVVGAILGVALILYFSMAYYALKHPGHWLFSKQYRPRILYCCVRRKYLEARMAERRAFMAQEREKWMATSIILSSTGVENQESAMPATKQTFWHSCFNCCRRWGLSEIRLTVAIYSVLNVLMYVIGFVLNFENGFKGHKAYPIAKGGGYMINLNIAMVVLPTLKSLQTAMRRIGSSREWMPIDDPISFHICVASYVFLGSVIHIAGHCWHVVYVATSPVLQDDPLELWNLGLEEEWSGKTVWEQLIWWEYRAAPATGIVLVLLMAPMYITAHTCVRRATNRITRRLGGFNLFFKVHMVWPWVLLLVLLHGSVRTWTWLFFPTILIFVDRSMLVQLQKLPLRLREVKVLPRDVIGLVFDVPTGFSYEAGQYIHLGWKNEWHPFTLTSAPEEGCISVHIRAPDALDWCSALRKHLTEELPQQAAEHMVSCEYKIPRPGTVIKYRRHENSRFPGILCKPDLSDVGEEGLARRPSRLSSFPSEEVRGSRTPKLPAGLSFETVWSTTLERPPEGTIALQVTGPFGAPAQKVWQFETIMVVGAGIGVTPFASILRSIQLRLQQHDIIMRAMEQSSYDPGESPLRAASSFARGLQLITGANAAVRATSSTTSSLSASAGLSPRPRDMATPAKLRRSTVESLERLVSEVITVPKKIMFYWIVRGQDEFDWFYDLLQAATEGPAKDIVEICLFLTGEIELSKVKALKCTGQWFGRPNWARIFKQNKEKYAGNHIGVFLCGSPVIGHELAKQSLQQSDPLGTRGGTRFSFYKEHF